MPKENLSLRLPSHRRHKPSGQAVVTLNGTDVYLGRWGTKASRTEYDRLIGEWLASGRCLPKAASPRAKGRSKPRSCRRGTR